MMSCFDFDYRGFVDGEDWRRGAKMMQMAGMGDDDALWEKLLSKYGDVGDDGDGVVYMDRLADFVPLDPRLALMMKAMVASVAGVAGFGREKRIPYDRRPLVRTD